MRRGRRGWGKGAHQGGAWLIQPCHGTRASVGPLALRVPVPRCPRLAWAWRSSIGAPEARPIEAFPRPWKEGMLERAGPPLHRLARGFPS